MATKKQIMLLKEPTNRSIASVIDKLNISQNRFQTEANKLEPGKDKDRFLRKVGQISKELDAIKELSVDDIITFALSEKRNLMALAANTRAPFQDRLRARIASHKPLSSYLARVKKLSEQESEQASSEEEDVPDDNNKELNKMVVNNQIVKMRNSVKRTKLYVINKLTRKIKMFRNYKGDGKIKKKYTRQAERLVKKMEYIQKLEPDEVSRFALTNELDFKKLATDVKSSVRLQALATLASHKFVANPVQDFKSANPNCIKAIPKMLMKKKKKRKLEVDKNPNVVQKNNESKMVDDQISGMEDNDEDCNSVSDHSAMEDNDEDCNSVSDHSAMEDNDEDCNSVSDHSAMEDNDEDCNSVSDHSAMEDNDEDCNSVSDHSAMEDNDEDCNSVSDHSEEHSDMDVKSNSEEGMNEDKATTKSLSREGNTSSTSEDESSENEEEKTLENRLDETGDNFKDVKELVKPHKQNIIMPKKEKDDDCNKKNKKLIRSTPEKTKVKENKPKVVDPFFMTASNEEYVTSQVPVISEEINHANFNKSRKESFFTKPQRFNKFDKHSMWNDKPGRENGPNSFNYNKNNKYNKPFKNSFDKRENGRPNSFNYNQNNKYSEHFKNSFEKTPNSFHGKSVIDTRNRKERRKAMHGEVQEVKVEKLHPSWEAKKKQTAIAAFQGKKITFS